MNRRRSADTPVTPMARRWAIQSSRHFKITLVPLHIRAASNSVYESLTILGKDCGLVRPKPTRIRIPCIESSRRTRQRRTAMALKVELKPHERIIIGNCVVTNTDQRARLLIDGDKIPILREKDIMTPENANTPAKLVYLAVQLMYIAPDPQINHGTYFSLVRDIVTAAPSAWPVIEEINNCILNGDMYQALKEAKKLVAYEKKLLDHNEAIRSQHAAA
jgi:flagellar protein FlbT